MRAAGRVNVRQRADDSPGTVPPGLSACPDTTTLPGVALHCVCTYPDGASFTCTEVGNAMGFLIKSPAECQAIVELREADAALHANSRQERKAGIRDETPEFLRLNAVANEAASKVSRWRGGTR